MLTSLVWAKGSTHCNFFHFPLDVKDFSRYFVAELQNPSRNIVVMKSRVVTALLFYGNTVKSVIRYS